MKLKSTWSTLAGGFSSAIPVLLSCCKGGACVGICISPAASLFGISAATIAASPVTKVLELILVALSAVSFTISYYSLYRLPKLNCATSGSCDCLPDAKSKRNNTLQKWIFWLGLCLSIGFLSYFEYSNYHSKNKSYSECGTSECAEERESCTAGCDSSASACCEKTTIENSTLSPMEKNTAAPLSCKLTSPELQKRKETVIASLKKQITERKELPNGYGFKFNGTDAVLDELNEFVKSERACCSFFTFSIAVEGETAWLSLTGPEGAKEMITSELGL